MFVREQLVQATKGFYELEAQNWRESHCLQPQLWRHVYAVE